MVDYKADADEPIAFQFKNPSWLRRYKFFTHKNLWSDGYNFTEHSSGRAVVKNCKTRKQAIEKAFKRITNAGRISFVDAVKNKIKQ